MEYLTRPISANRSPHSKTRPNTKSPDLFINQIKFIIIKIKYSLPPRNLFSSPVCYPGTSLSGAFVTGCVYPYAPIFPPPPYPCCIFWPPYAGYAGYPGGAGLPTGCGGGGGTKVESARFFRKRKKRRMPMIAMARNAPIAMPAIAPLESFDGEGVGGMIGPADWTCAGGGVIPGEIGVVPVKAGGV